MKYKCWYHKNSRLCKIREHYVLFKKPKLYSSIEQITYYYILNDVAVSWFEKVYQHSPLFMQNLLISAYGYQWKQRRMGGIFSRCYHEVKERENFTQNEWLTYQNEQLQKLLFQAYKNVPYYAKAFNSRGLNEKKLKQITTSNISGLPVLTKQDLRLFGTTTLLANNKESKGTFFSSSGSTGTPVEILFSHKMHQRWFAIFEARVRNWAGVSSNMSRGMIGGRRVLPTAANKPPFYRYNHFEKQVYFSAYHISKATAYGYLQGMKIYKVAYMTGYAMSNYFLAKFIKDAGYEAPALKAVITSSEKLTNEMREVFKDVYDCKTYDGWSGVEACGLISECENGSLHISPDAGIIEVLDENLKTINFGEAGYVYCTGFLNYDQPLIRYKIGDQIILSDKRCDCGRSMPVVTEIVGRIEDVVKGKDGRQMVRFHSVFNGLKMVVQSQVIQESLDAITVKVVLDEALSETETELIKQRIISQLGLIEIDIKQVSHIPLSRNGKFQAVVSKI